MIRHQQVQYFLLVLIHIEQMIVVVVILPMSGQVYQDIQNLGPTQEMEMQMVRLFIQDLNQVF